MIDLYEAAKTWLGVTTLLSRDALRIYLVVGIQLVSAQFFARRLASVGPLVIVAALQLLNERVGFLGYKAEGPIRLAGWWPDTVIDMFNSAALPLLLFAVARFLPGALVSRRPVDRPAPGSDEERIGTAEGP